MTSTATSSSKHEALKTDGLLLEKLAAVLPKAAKLSIYHISTPPTKTTALCSPPPDERPDKTFVENHFLAVSIDAEPSSVATGADAVKQVLVLALEVYIFTTAFSTTIFVSKADSTGYLHLLSVPKGTASPVREVCSTFIEFLVEHRRRPAIQTVVSLFARAQSQYLFPGSVNNPGKHILEDRGLVKWWCRVLNGLLEKEVESANHRSRIRDGWRARQGYLIVPGMESYETRAFLPRTSAALAKWEIGHPLERISHYTNEYDWVPLRCLIPRYPDDPKSRFRDELDEEAAKWKQDTGAWKSIKTLDQFWEMMAIRQECSSGRLTGFIWLVFDPVTRPSVEDKTEWSSAAVAFVPPLLTPTSSFDTSMPAALPPSTPPRRRVDITASTPHSSPLKLGSTPGSVMSTPSKRARDEENKSKKKKKLKGPIIPRQPQIKTHRRNYLLDRPSSSPYYTWPPEGRGERIVDEVDYKRIVELLLHLDFGTLEKASLSTTRWINEVAMGDVASWGRRIIGTKEPSTVDGGSVPTVVTNLSGLVKRKQPAQEGTVPTPWPSANDAQSQPQTQVNLLSAGLVRKKRKDEHQVPATVDASSSVTASIQTANVLGAGLVRKKPKPT